jgi:imidazolonepropionase-like amidohydrolase
MENIVLTADRLVDGTGSAAILRPVLRIAGETVLASETSLLPPAGCGGSRFDFPGCTILPGLIDTHVHLIFSAAETHGEVIEQVCRECDDELFARAAANARAALNSGITTLRDCGGRGTITQRLRDAIRRGDIDGPDVISCGVPITTTTGHCHWLGLTADTPGDVGRAAERMIADGADWLKVMATGGNMTPSSDPMTAQYDDESLALIADIGRRAGRHSAAHVLSRCALPGVVRANYRTIEHCDWRVEENRYAFDPELARRIRDQGQYVGLTMSGTARRAFLSQVAAATDFGPVKRLDIRLSN